MVRFRHLSKVLRLCCIREVLFTFHFSAKYWRSLQLPETKTSTNLRTQYLKTLKKCLVDASFPVTVILLGLIALTPQKFIGARDTPGIVLCALHPRPLKIDPWSNEFGFWKCCWMSFLRCAAETSSRMESCLRYRCCGGPPSTKTCTPQTTAAVGMFFRVYWIGILPSQEHDFPVSSLKCRTEIFTPCEPVLCVRHETTQTQWRRNRFYLAKDSSYDAGKISRSDVSATFQL